MIFNPPVILGFKALRVTEREVEIWLCLVLRQARHATVIRPHRPILWLCHAPPGIAWGALSTTDCGQNRCHRLAEAHPLQLEHLRMCKDIH